MQLLKYPVLCFLCFGAAVCSTTYRAAVDVSIGNKYLSLVHKVAESNVDIVMLPEILIESCADGQDEYDQIMDTLSNAIKAAGVYAAVELTERCRNKGDGSRSHLIFDRTGELITEKMFKRDASSNVENFTTDFGVTFGILKEYDIILNNFEEYGDIKNFLLFGSLEEKEYLFAKKFPSAWAYATTSNVISASGIYGGRSLQTGSIIMADLQKENNDVSSLEVHPINLNTYPGEDMSQYTIRPLDFESGKSGYTTNVCHSSFCCEFHIKTRKNGSNDVSYGLVAFEGVHNVGMKNIGAQSCLVVACAGLYKRSCFNESENNSTITEFERLTIKGVFTKNNTAQFPIIHTSSKTLLNNNFNFKTKNVKDTKHVTASLKNVQNILTFGIFGRQFDVDGHFESSDGIDVTDYISSENVQEIFDYLWIRLRVVIFIVSIYVLEMM